MEYRNLFLRKIEVIKLYMVKFEENHFIKSKIYSKNCAIGDLNL